MIKDIHIQNYHSIKDLKINDCKRINLLVGKNEVGKTTVLEFIKQSYHKEYAPFYSSWRAFKTNQDSKIILFDEIENGLHHSVMKDFWRYIIKMALANNFQIFATTHSHEMMEALVKAAEETNLIEQEEIRVYRLHKNEEGNGVMKFESWATDQLIKEGRNMRDGDPCLHNITEFSSEQFCKFIEKK